MLESTKISFLFHPRFYTNKTTNIKYKFLFVLYHLSVFRFIYDIFFICSYYASTAFPVAPTRLVPPIKRQRLMTTARNGKNNQSQKTTSIPPLDQLKVYSKFYLAEITNRRRTVSNIDFI